MSFLDELRNILVPHGLISSPEETRTYECDGLTNFRVWITSQHLQHRENGRVIEIGEYINCRFAHLLWLLGPSGRDHD